ncbi:unnamed protein product [Rotaria sordida]|uniref:Uncharacterized protein n=1 Tax=Rotaria sordida TaxID=392033 RepID=A0A813NUX8_9BILA|nr:unnamed protein product [Rotaria sordida]
MTVIMKLFFHDELAKPPPPGRPIAPPRGKHAPYPKPFPALTPESFIPGAPGGGFYPGIPPMGGASKFPLLTPNSFLPPPGTLEPPIMNYSGGLGMGYPYPPMPPMPPLQPILPPMPYPNQGPMSIIESPPPSYDPGLHSYCRRPVRICRRNRRSRRCRPVIHIIDSSSYSSLSSCSTISSCSRRRHRSHSHSRRCTAAAPQQQPIILLPVPCQQSQPPLAALGQNQIQQQPQQIVLPPLQFQQSGQIQQQQQQQQLALPMQQQVLALPPLQLSPSNLIGSTASSPIIISNGQPMLQPSMSLPQFTNIGQPQQINAGPIQYVQAIPQSSSPLQYVSREPRAAITPQRSLVNSTKKKKATKIKTVPKSNSVRDLPQYDLKFGRRPFDWYDSDRKNNVIDEKIQIGQRGSTTLR